MENPFQLVARYGLPPIRSVIQVGASGGQEIPMFQENGIEYAAMIEPLDYPFSVLCSNCQGKGNFLPIQSGVGPRDGEVTTFYVASNDGQSSSLLKPAQHLTIFPYVSFTQEVNVSCFTLDAIIRSVPVTNTSFPAHYDLIYIDVQGAELEVFKGASKALSQSKYIFTEVGHGGGYEKDVSCLQLIQYLGAYNYKLIELTIDPNTGYGDAFFMRFD